MNEFSRIIHTIRKAKSEPPLWIPFSYPRLKHHVGISKGLYHLFGGNPGSGKTSFIDSTYVLDAHDWVYENPDSDIKLKTIYFSMERSKDYKKAKWLAHRLYTHSDILVSVPDLLNWGTGAQISDAIIEQAEQHSDFFNKLYDDVTIYEGIRNPTGIYKIMMATALQHGIIYGREEDGSYYKITYEGWQEENKEKKEPINRSESPVQLKPRNREYVPYDEKLIIQVILDHIGLPRPERGFSTKQTIDKTSEYLRIARDFLKMGVVVVSQFNRNNANIQRRINTDLSPERQDFKGSGNTYEDADIAIGLFNPYSLGIDNYKGYYINKTKFNDFSRFRSVTVLKNSYGIDNQVAGFKFVGECGYFEQIPKPNEINYEEVFNE